MVLLTFSFNVIRPNVSISDIKTSHFERAVTLKKVRSDLNPGTRPLYMGCMLYQLSYWSAPTALLI